jgi:nitrite reductase/ring-hydroxylating ferredoxin subunit
VRFAFIAQHQEIYPVSEMCVLFEVSRSGYYDFLKRQEQGPSQREQENERLLVKIKEIHEGSQARYGSPRIHATLLKQKVRCSLGRVKRLMRRDPKYFSTYYALDGICPHAGGPLGKGAVHGCIVTCPWHGWQFDVTNGQHCLNANIRQATFPVRVEGDEVYVELP